MQVRQTAIDGGIEIGIGGVLDASNADDLRALIDDLAALQPRRVVLCLRDLTRVDSSGVAVLITIFRRLSTAGTTVEFVSLNGQPRKVFELLNLGYLLSGE